MKNRKKLMEAINALYLEVDSTIADEIKAKVYLAMDEEYDRGIADGKIIQEHGTVNWIT